MRHCYQFWLALLIGAMLAMPASAGLKSSHLPVSDKTKQPRILTVSTRDDRMFVAGQNLPQGEDLEVRLGTLQLEVLHVTATLLVARLPRLPLDQDYELTIKRGVREASIRASAATWGFVLPH
jgi:hypothetical protein